MATFPLYFQNTAGIKNSTVHVFLLNPTGFSIIACLNYLIEIFRFSRYAITSLAVDFFYPCFLLISLALLWLVNFKINKLLKVMN